MASISQDTILVSSGTYYENVHFQGKSLAIIADGDVTSTVIDGQGAGSVVQIDVGGLLAGFTIRNGHAVTGGGIRVSGSNGTVIRDNIIENNIAGFGFDSGRGGGLWARSVSNVRIEGNTFHQNAAGASGGGIDMLCFENCDILANRIEANACHVGGGGANLSGTLRLANNAILLNTADSFGAGIEYSGDGFIEGNTIAGNYNNNSAPHGAGLRVSAAPTLQIVRNLIVGNGGNAGSGIGIVATDGVIKCNNAWNNDFANFSFVGPVDTTNGRNISTDPIFCEAGYSSIAIADGSPCAPIHSGGCGLIGAGSPQCALTSAKRETWGALKNRYRGGEQ